MSSKKQLLTRRGLFGLAVGAAVSSLAACGSAEAPRADATIPEATEPNYDLASGIVTLSNGVGMPITGIGTYALSPDEAAESVYWCIEAGGRLIDTAAAYNNEEGVGRGIAQAIVDGPCSREDLFVTTKLWQDGYSERGVDGALTRLGLDYVDLLFVHQAMGDYRHGYEVVLAAQEAGKTRCVGLSNHTDGQFAEVVDAFFSSFFPLTTHMVASNFWNPLAQVAYGVVILLVTAANVVLYARLRADNGQVEGLPQGILGSTRNMALDIALKLVGITLSATVFPPAMVCSVLIMLCCIVLPQQLRG